MKNIIVTGASNGIGMAVAKALKKSTMSSILILKKKI